MSIAHLFNIRITQIARFFDLEVGQYLVSTKLDSSPPYSNGKNLHYNYHIESFRNADHKTQQDRGNTQTSPVKKTDEFFQALY